MNATPTATRITTYDQLQADPEFPKSRFGFVKWMFKNMWRGIKKGFPKNLLFPLIFGLLYWLFNLFFLSYINDSCFFGNGRFSSSSLLPYLFGGLLYKDYGLKGFDVPGKEITTWFYIMTLMLALTQLIGCLFQRVRAKGAAAPFRDLFAIPKLAKAYRNSCSHSLARAVLPCMGIAFLLGFFLKSPFTILFLALFFLFSFGQGNENPLVYIRFVYLAAKNLGSKKEKKTIYDGDAALPLLGLGLGFLLDFIVVVIIWNLFNYNIWSRSIFTLLFSGLFLFLGMGGSIHFKSKPAKTICLLFVGLGLLPLFETVVFAHDGGWTESGQNFPGWLANPGTAIMAGAGLGGPAGTLVGWAIDMVFGGTLDFFTGGAGSAAAGTAAGGMGGDLLDLGLAALGTGLSPLGPVGNQITNAWGSAIDALGGGGQGGSSSGGSSGGGTSGGGSSGGGSSGGSSGGGSSGGGSSSGGSSSGGSSGGSSSSGGSGSGTEPEPMQEIPDSQMKPKPEHTVGFCGNCGSPKAPGQRFCGNCGSPV